MLSLLLQKRNIECDFAYDGKEAIDLVKVNGNNMYTMIFMDFAMPTVVSRTEPNCA
jgi:CheY-like chemotaxis protein